MDYIAGISDGEGYSGRWKTKSRSLLRAYGYRPGIKIAMVDCDDLIYALCDEFGGHIHNRTAKQANHRNSTCWELKGKKLLKPFLEDITPHLRLKTRQAELLYEFCQIGNLHPLYAPQERFVQAETIYRELLALKHESPATTKRGRPDQVMLKVKR